MDEKRIHCLGCGARSPEVETEYTLISSRFGWRLSRRVARDGSAILEWRCPTCWARYKQERTGTPGDAAAEPPASSRGEAAPVSRREPKR